MARKHLTDYPDEVSQIQHALRIGAKQEEYVAVVKSLNRKVRFECALGEAIDSLAGFAWAWRMKGLYGVPEPIVKADKLNAQGLEGKLSIEVTLYDALFYAMQASSPYRTQIIE
jgi:hypothetical protein